MRSGTHVMIGLLRAHRRTTNAHVGVIGFAVKRNRAMHQNRATTGQTNLGNLLARRAFLMVDIREIAKTLYNYSASSYETLDGSKKGNSLFWHVRLINGLINIAFG